MCVCVCVGGGVSVKGKYLYKTKEALAKNTLNYLNITLMVGWALVSLYHGLKVIKYQ